MSDINELVRKIEYWSNQRNLPNGSDPKSQFLKTSEEVGELADAIAKMNTVEVKDAIGDIVVTLVIQCQMQGLEFDDCIAHAWDEIKDRKGKMINGVFVKEK